ncbi:hypothetical protein [Streptomyces sp. NPDC003832]
MLRKFVVAVACAIALVAAGTGPATAVPAEEGQWQTPNGVLGAQVTDAHVSVAYYRRAGAAVEVAVGYADNVGDHRSGFVRLAPGQQQSTVWERDALSGGCVTVYAQFRNDREEHVLCP